MNFSGHCGISKTWKKNFFLQLKLSEHRHEVINDMELLQKALFNLPRVNDGSGIRRKSFLHFFENKTTSESNFNKYFVKRQHCKPLAMRLKKKTVGPDDKRGLFFWCFSISNQSPGLKDWMGWEREEGGSRSILCTPGNVSYRSRSAGECPKREKKSTWSKNQWQGSSANESCSQCPAEALCF